MSVTEATGGMIIGTTITIITARVHDRPIAPTAPIDPTVPIARIVRVHVRREDNRFSLPSGA